MDAHAHLLSLGWAGPGHSLDSRPYKQKGHRGLAYDPKAQSQTQNTGNGLVKPLLISQRQGRFGIGKKVHEPQAGNEWWLKGFESALGNIGKSESERSSGTATPEVNSGKHNGLYSFFVKGQEMKGTIGEETRSKKRKSDRMEGQHDEFEQVSAFIAVRDQDEHRRSKVDRPTAMEEFAQVKDFFNARAKRKSNVAAHLEEGESVEEDSVDTSLQQAETKEERRERRRRRKIEEKKAIVGTPAADDDDATTKAARKAERKRRKQDKI